MFFFAVPETDSFFVDFYKELRDLPSADEPPPRARRPATTGLGKLFLCDKGPGGFAAILPIKANRDHATGHKGEEHVS